MDASAAVRFWISRSSDAANADRPGDETRDPLPRSAGSSVPRYRWRKCNWNSGQPLNPRLWANRTTVATLTGKIAKGHLTLNAKGVRDADGKIASISFYQDSNANGQLDESDQLLRSSTKAMFSGASSTAAGQSATFFVRAQDADGATSVVKSVSLIAAP